jgi:putative DNA primase/helicase
MTPGMPSIATGATARVAPERADADDGAEVVSIDGARRFNLTDLGNAERFVAQHGEELHYLATMGAWLVWDGRRWVKDETGEAERRAKGTVRSMYAAAAKVRNDKDLRTAMVDHARRSESNNRIKAMLVLAQTELRADGGAVARMPGDFDADPWVLNVANGVLDLRTARLRPHDPTLRCRKLAPVAWDPEAPCPTWERFVARVLGERPELIRYVRRAVGYALTGRTDEQCLFFLHGRGANGKSTFLETLRRLAGDYAIQADFSTLAEKKGDGPRNDVARLERARLVTASELGEGKRLNEELVKSLTGSETITARFLHKEFFEFRPEFKLWLAANHKPVIRGTDDGIWRRVRLIPFEVQIPEAERDPALQDKLVAELPGILAWAVSGCLEWQRDGLPMPSEVRQATAAYREESDVLGAWVAEACEVAPGKATPASLLYANYRRWAETGGEYVMSQTAFGRRLQERGLVAEKRGTGADRVIWRVGIALHPSAVQTVTNGAFGGSYAAR